MVLGYSRAPYRFQKDLVLAKEFSLLHEIYCCWPRNYMALVLFNFLWPPIKLARAWPKLVDTKLRERHASFHTPLDFYGVQRWTVAQALSGDQT